MRLVDINRRTPVWSVLTRATITINPLTRRASVGNVLDLTAIIEDQAVNQICKIGNPGT
jgi:hypothetical protein